MPRLLLRKQQSQGHSSGLVDADRVLLRVVVSVVIGGAVVESGVWASLGLLVCSFVRSIKKRAHPRFNSKAQSSQVKCLIPISQRAAKAVRAITLRVLVVFCGAAPPVFQRPENTLLKDALDGTWVLAVVFSTRGVSACA